MRVIVKLSSLKDCAYDMKYYSKLRGFIYSLIKDSKYFNVHNNEFKFFCFSNIFPANDVKTDETRYFIVSSPDSDFITFLAGKLYDKMRQKERVLIGEYEFLIKDLKTIDVRIGKKLRLISGTPIVIRIPKENYDEYGIKSKRSYEYWRPDYDFRAFLRQLTNNLIKKYNLYYDKKIKEMNLFEVFHFVKSVSVHRIEDGREVITIGSLWKFEFNFLDKIQRQILKFGIDAGFGELNSSGFGFVNVY